MTGTTERPARSNRGRWVATVLAAATVAGLVAVLAGGLGGSVTRTVGTALAGHPAPPLAGRTITGGHADLRALRGHVVLVNVWAPWCTPCRDELPLLAQTAGTWRASGLEVLGVATRTTPQAARDLLRSSGAADLVSVDDPTGALAVSWGARGVPETFVVDQDGVVRARCYGPLTAAWLQQHVEPLVRS